MDFDKWTDDQVKSLLNDILNPDTLINEYGDCFISSIFE